jgi:uncharacterized protein YeaO (DUF488 family)
VVRVYNDPGRTGGEYRALIDRLWPRGLRKDALDCDQWLRDIAPSDALRRWFGHDPDRFLEFSRRYRRELKSSPANAARARLTTAARGRAITLLTATRDVEHSGAAVLQEVLGQSQERF